MKNRFTFVSALALMAIASLSACGGGGSAGGGSVTTPPTSVPNGASHVAILWNGIAHSTGTPTQSLFRSANGITTQASTVSGEPIEVAVAPPCIPTNQNTCTSVIAEANMNGAVVHATEVNAQGTPLPNSPSSASVNASTVASIAPVPTVSPSPGASPTPAPYQLSTTTQTPAQATLTVGFADGTTGTLPVNAYAYIGMGAPCNPCENTGEAQAWVLQNGSFGTTTAISSADVWMSVDNGVNTVHFPAGYQLYPQNTPISNVTTALPFTSAGTSVPLAQLSGTGVNALFAVRSTPGVYGFIRISITKCVWSSTGSSSTCDVQGKLDGIVKVSNASGTFSN